VVWNNYVCLRGKAPESRQKRIGNRPQRIAESYLHAIDVELAVGNPQAITWNTGDPLGIDLRCREARNAVTREDNNVP
jgi:hypothetical protein